MAKGAIAQFKLELVDQNIFAKGQRKGIFTNLHSYIGVQFYHALLLRSQYGIAAKIVPGP
jgi:hypothetical protein